MKQINYSLMTRLSRQQIRTFGKTIQDEQQVIHGPALDDLTIFIMRGAQVSETVVSALHCQQPHKYTKLL
jgi:hypothetical protein